MGGRAVRVGLTMRHSLAGQAGADPRDWLSADWVGFLERAMPEALWLPLPNSKAAVCLARELKLDGVIFTGGEDVGSVPARDDTEAALLDLCLREGLAVAGVCRGLQFITVALGGSLSRCDETAHVAARHVVRIADVQAKASSRSVMLGISQGPREVNSYHRWGVLPGGMAPGLDALAVSPDGVVEALSSPERRIVAVQWHPEREAQVHPGDAAWLRALFMPGKEEFHVHRG